MHVPPSTTTFLRATASRPYFVTRQGNGTGWSSLIGIVTAIIGNILISFALNIQRYAHKRLDREYQDSREASKGGVGTTRKPRGYGAIEQERIAEQRLRINAQAPGPGENADGDLQEGTEDHDDETRPLKSSCHSEDTLHNEEKGDADDHGRKSYLKSPYWWLGIVMMTVGEAGNFLAYGFAPASIVSPLGVVALISNCLIAPLMLKERFRQRDLWGVLVAIGGAVTVVLSAKQAEPRFGPDTLWDRYIKRWEFLVYVLITTAFIIGLMYASPKYGRRTILIDLGLVGLFGGYTALSTKGVASLLSGSLYKTFTFPITYVLILVLVSSAIMQIRYLNRALQNYDSTQVIPIQFVLFTLSVIIGSAVLYRDFESTTLDRAIKFIAGCLLTFFGVYLITSQRRDDAGEEDDVSEHDETIQLVDDEEAHEVDESTPLKHDRSHLDIKQTDQPTSPDRSTLRTPRRLSQASSGVPSIAVTPAESSEDLTPNPWRSSTDELSRPLPKTPPPIARLQSETDATPFYTPATSYPQLRRAPSSPADPMTPTPTRGKRGPSPPKADRPPASPSPHSHSAQALARSARGSISRLLPGPLLPPLSSSLSAVVADSLLKGEGSSPSVRATLRRNRSTRTAETRRRSSFLGPAMPDEESGNGTPYSSTGGPYSRSGEISRQQTRETLPLPDVRDVVEEETDVGTKKTRLRSMSETLGGLMKGKRERGKRRAGEDEGGGGGGIG